jgi:hypothetical protein
VYDDDVRSAGEVAERVAALTALLVRLSIETAARNDPGAGAAHRARFEQWLVDEGVGPLLSPHEQELVAAPALDDMIAFDARWRLQAIAALLWALGRLGAMPPYHRAITADAVEEWLPIWRPIAPLIAGARLVPEAKLEAERERAELWHWRVRMELLRLQGMLPPAGDTFEAAIERAATAARERGIIERVRDGDFDCGGVAFGTLSGPELGDASSSIIERHYALNWLTGSAAWDDVRVDT